MSGRASSLLFIALLSCDGSGAVSDTMPLGWRGLILWCDGAEIVKGAALRKQSTGYLEAVAVGRATLRCKDKGHTVDVAVKPIGRLAIVGPRTITAGESPRYELQAFTADDEELSFGEIEDQPSEHVVTWTTSSGTIGMPPRSDMLPSPSPRVDHVRLVPEGGTTITISATFATTTTKAVITVR